MSLVDDDLSENPEDGEPNNQASSSASGNQRNSQMALSPVLDPFQEPEQEAEDLLQSVINLTSEEQPSPSRVSAASSSSSSSSSSKKVVEGPPSPSNIRKKAPVAVAAAVTEPPPVPSSAVSIADGHSSLSSPKPQIALQMDASPPLSSSASIFAVGTELPSIGSSSTVPIPVLTAHPLTPESFEPNKIIVFASSTSAVPLSTVPSPSSPSPFSPSSSSSSASSLESSGSSSSSSSAPLPVMSGDIAAALSASIPVSLDPSCVNPDGLDAFEKVKLVGRGDVGRVYLVRHKPTGKPYAMKVMAKKDMIARNKIQRALTEREILATTHHPFIVTMAYCFQNSDSLFFVMDFCAGGEFFRALQKQPNKCLSEQGAKFYAAEVLLGLEYLHLMGFIYRDLKPENILLHSSGHIRLTDFNLSKQAKTPVFAKIVKNYFNEEDNLVQVKPELMTNSFVGTEEYIAPEVILGEGHGSSVDWWTFGILLYEMLFGFTPFKGRNQEETFSLIVKCGLNFPDKPIVSRECKSMIRKLLSPDSKKRLGAEHGASDIKAHAWFADVKWALLLNQEPPIVPVVDGPFDTRNFRCYQDDHKVTLSGKEMMESDHSEGDPFSQFARFTPDLASPSKSKNKSGGLATSSSSVSPSSSSSSVPHSSSSSSSSSTPLTPPKTNSSSSLKVSGTPSSSSSSSSAVKPSNSSK